MLTVGPHISKVLLATNPYTGFYPWSDPANSAYLGRDNLFLMAYS